MTNIENRFSLYRDASGYLNYRVIDKNGNIFNVSSDVSSWKAGEQHHVAASWVLNSQTNQDEMHLFIDGEETSNILKYGGHVSGTLHQKFRTISTDDIIGEVPKNIVGSTDLITTIGSDEVSSSLNFTDLGINAGDLLYIEESGFDSSGYTIANVNGDILTLSTTMPLSASDCNFSVNKVSFIVDTQINLYNNIAVSFIHSSIDGDDLITTATDNTVSSVGYDFGSGDVHIGNLLKIDESGFGDYYIITGISGNTLTLSDNMPLSTSGSSFLIYSNTEEELPGQNALFPSYEISRDGYFNNILTVKAGVEATDILLIRTLGLNHGRVRNKYYSWGNRWSLWNNTLNGIGIQDMADANQTPSNSIYRYTTIKTTGTLTDYRTLTLPTVANNSDIYTKIINNSCEGMIGDSDGYIVVDSGAITTVTIPNGTTSTVLVNSRGVISVSSSALSILNTRLPSPLLLEDVKIYHTLLDTTVIGPNNSTLSLGTFTSSNLATDQPSISDNGRTLLVTISGDNIDYTSDVTVLIDGVIDGAASTETLTFSANEAQVTIGKISLINFAVVTCTPINSARGCCTVKIREKEPITTAEDSTSVPVIRYSYQMLVGNTLSGTIGTAIVSDASIQFSVENIGNYLTIYSPPSVAGQYLITDVSDDLLSITLNSNLSASFTNGNYEVLNVTSARSGLQNGRFVFEEAASPGTPYLLAQGLYELDYHIGLSIPLEAKNYNGFIGSDMNKENPGKVIIDDFFILDTKLSDTRIGEVLGSGQDSITKRYNSLKAAKPNSGTLMLLDFDNTGEPINNTDVYLTSDSGFIQSSIGVNSNFNKSIIFTNNPLLVDNTGILNVKNEGTIEFWVNPLNDTGNDPNYRFYFDATGIVTEKITSTNNSTVIIAGRASEVLNIKLKNGSQTIDYFAGGTIGDDQQTLFLNKKLPNQNTLVIVSYIPAGISGDRMSIYKDPFGYINFTITGSGISHQVRAPIFWPKNTWHKLKAQYKINQGLGTDEIRFFIDGYEQGNILFGNGLLFGENLVFGSSFVGHNSIQSSISFTDAINEFTIGSDYTHVLGAQALIDNLRISNVSRPIFMPFGESVDPSYSSNLNIVFPSTEDLYTTLLLDFNKLVEKTTDFAVIKNRLTGNFDITINVFDSFGILRDNNKAKDILEVLLDTLKPANSRIFLKYV